MKTVIKLDNDGHKFKIPVEMAVEFDQMFDHYIEQKRGTAAYWDAEADFNNKFEKYLVGWN
jgi:hypothetical protein